MKRKKISKKFRQRYVKTLRPHMRPLCDTAVEEQSKCKNNKGSEYYVRRHCYLVQYVVVTSKSEHTKVGQERARKSEYV